MLNMAIDGLLTLTLAFCMLAVIAPLAAFAEPGSVVYGSVYVDGSPMSGVIVTCGDQSTTTLRSGNYVFSLDTGVDVQVIAVYGDNFALSDEFVTSALPIRKDLNIAIPDTPKPTPTPTPGPQTVYVTVTVTTAPAQSHNTTVRERTSLNETPTPTVMPSPSPTKTQSPGFAALLAMACLACAALIISKRKGQ